MALHLGVEIAVQRAAELTAQAASAWELSALLAEVDHGVPVGRHACYHCQRRTSCPNVAQQLPEAITVPRVREEIRNDAVIVEIMRLLRAGERPPLNDKRFTPKGHLEIEIDQQENPRISLQKKKERKTSKKK